jgi:hypothetical protein
MSQKTKMTAPCLVFAFLEVNQQTEVKVWFRLVDLGSIDHGSNPGSPTTFWVSNLLGMGPVGSANGSETIWVWVQLNLLP